MLTGNKWKIIIKSTQVGPMPIVSIEKIYCNYYLSKLHFEKKYQQ